MKTKFLFLSLLASIFVQAQNVGVNTSTPEAALDINGDIIIRPADLSVADGITVSLDVNTAKFSYYRISGPTADFSIGGISAGIDGRLITFFNRTGFTMLLTNEDPGAITTDMIVTGSGADITIPNKGIVNLQYDGVEQKWIVKSSSKGNSGGTGNWDLNGANIFNTNAGYVGIGTSNPTSPLTLQTTTGSAGWTHIAGNDEIIVNESIGGVSSSLGTMTDHTFRLKTNGEGRLHILNDGRVTISPNDYQPFGQFTVHTLTSGYGISHTDGDVVISTYAGGIPARGYVGTQSNHPLSFYANGGASRMILLPDGNVGIGTTTPTAKLHLAGSQKIDGTNTIEFGAGVAGKEVNAGKIGYQTFTAGALDIIGAGTVSGNRKIRFWNEGGAIFNGRVGIGTLNPAHPLSVNGTIQSTEVVVETGWADYVFDNDYRLLPIAEVEKFIRKNKHLPNIPSAKEIKEKGLSLGDTQRRMMEKIEELTLYVIELKKEIDTLKSKF